MVDIITIGEILAEVLTGRVGQVFYEPGTLLGPYPSGAPAICIDQAARMGASAAIISKVGKDDFGRLNLERLKGNGVDVSHVIQTEDNTTGVAFVTYFADGSRQFIFHFSKAACGELRPADVDEEAIKNSRYLHIMGCSITGSPTLGEAIMQAVRLARKNGVRISFDPNIRPELLHGRIMDYFREIIDACDVLLAGKSELRLLFGDTEAAIRQLLTQKDRILAIKDGARGTGVYTRREAFSIGTYPAVEADPTGAGDCFDGTFLAMLCDGADLSTAARYANAAGAKAVEKRGPMEGNTFRAEVEAFLREAPGTPERVLKNPYQAV
ncbi:MAG TPA: sugar kinase [Feifaniaceae bacterium]|nr:sugar kinase [Feifaniaceae bacterium]